MIITATPSPSGKPGELQSAVLFDLLGPYRDRIAGVPPVWIGCTDYYLGLLATTLGRYDDSDTHFGAAAATHHRIVAPAWLARTGLEWARMLLRRRRPGDAEHARDLLGEAMDTARTHALVDAERRIAALLQGPERSQLT